MSNLWKMVLLALPCLFAGLGCVESDAIKYNNEIAGITRDMEYLGREFGEQLKQHMGKPAKLQELHTETVKKGETIIQRGKGLTAPNTSEGKALHQAFLAFLETEGEILRVDFGRITRYAGANQLSALTPALNQMQKREQEKVSQLKMAQQAFAKANKFRVQ